MYVGIDDNRDSVTSLLGEKKIDVEIEERE